MRTAALLAACAMLAAGAPRAQERDPNSALANEVITARLAGRSISGLVTHRPGASGFTRGIALFPGHPGILRLRIDADEPQFEMRGNFLIRSRRHWADERTLTVAMDAPDDEWAGFAQHFRATPRYAEDLRALIAAVEARYGKLDWTFVGTSEGSVSAFHAARMLPETARRVILTASVFRPGRHGPGLADADWSQLKPALLWVHHEDDPCPFTRYADARRFAERTRAPLVTVRGGGPARGEACQARTQHGFVGAEREVVQAMRGWIETGQAPESVSP